MLQYLNSELTMIQKSPLPLFIKEGDYSSLQQREVRRRI